MMGKQKNSYIYILQDNCFFITKVSESYSMFFNENTMEIVWKLKLWTDGKSFLEICIEISNFLTCRLVNINTH